MLVMLECCILLIDTVVCEVHVLLLLACRSSLAVFARCKTSQAFLIHVDTQWIYASHCDINAHVEFVSIEKQRIRNVFTHYIIRAATFLRYIRQFTCHKDATTLSLSCWLENPLFSYVSLHVVLQELVLVGQDIGLG